VAVLLGGSGTLLGPVGSLSGVVGSFSGVVGSFSGAGVGVEDEGSGRYGLLLLLLLRLLVARGVGVGSRWSALGGRDVRGCLGRDVGGIRSRLGVDRGAVVGRRSLPVGGVLVLLGLDAGGGLGGTLLQILRCGDPVVLLAANRVESIGQSRHGIDYLSRWLLLLDRLELGDDLAFQIGKLPLVEVGESVEHLLDAIHC